MSFVAQPYHKNKLLSSSDIDQSVRDSHGYREIILDAAAEVDRAIDRRVKQDEFWLKYHKDTH